MRHPDRPVRDGGFSRRDFLRLRPAGHHELRLEVSCRNLFMRCTDAGLESVPDDPYEPWMGEPPTRVRRASIDDLVQAFVRELDGIQVLRLLEPEWLEGLDAAPGFRAAIARFEARGGRVE